MGQGSLAIAPAAGGKYVVAGSNGSGDVRIIRLNNNLSLDTTFGSGGATTVGLGGNDDRATGVAVRSDGKVLVTGASSATSGRFTLIRLNSNGTIDGSFDGDGKLITQFGSSGGANALTIDSGGRVVVVGTIDNHIAVARFVGAGKDNDFSGDGWTPVPIGSGSTGRSVAMQGDKILVGGASGGNFAVARLLG